jgi:uncharacterized SAM-binding protein YcdF (DUF218 family)
MAKTLWWARRVKASLLGLATILALSTTILGHRTILMSLGQFLLIEEEELRPADVIHVLGGRYERTRYTLQLYRQGYGHKLFFTGEEVAPLFMRAAIFQGVPIADVIPFQSKAINTYQEALELKQFLAQEPQFRSVIVVSSPYHMRRARWIFGQVMGPQVDIQFAPVPFGQTADHQQWWTDGKSREKVAQEYLKLLLHFMRYQFKEE